MLRAKVDPLRFTMHWYGPNNCVIYPDPKSDLDRGHKRERKHRKKRDDNDDDDDDDEFTGFDGPSSQKKTARSD